MARAALGGRPCSFGNNRGWVTRHFQADLDLQQGLFGCIAHHGRSPVSIAAHIVAGTVHESTMAKNTEA